MRKTLLLGCAAAITSHTAFAQTPVGTSTSQAAEPDDSIADIIVTAQFRASNLQQTPLAITAVNSAMLEARGIDNVTQVAQSAPSVSLTPTAAAFGKGTSAFIRGIGQFDFSPALDPGVGIYIDDVYFATVFGSAFDLVDVDRVEVLRGPQGTLAGKNSIGGAIKLFSKKPDGKGDGYVSLSYGSYKHLIARGSADFTIVPDKLFARISGVAKQGGGYVKRLDYGCANPGNAQGIAAGPSTGSNCKVDTTGGESLAAGRIYLRAIPTDRLEISLIADVTQDSSEPAASTLISAVPKIYFGTPYDLTPYVPKNPYTTYAPYFGTVNPVTNQSRAVPPTSQVDGWGVSGTIDYELSDNFSVKSITAYRNVDGHFSLDDETPVDAILYYQGLRSKQFTEEFRLNGKIGQSFNFTVGGFYFNNKIVNAGSTFVGSTFDIVLDDHVHSKSKAVFAQGELSITDEFKVIGGIRYTKDDKSFTFGRGEAQTPPYGLFGLFGLNTAVNGATRRFKGNRTDWRIAANYQLTPDVMTYAQASTGYKGGGVNPRPFTLAQILPFQPETVTSYELGVKSWLFDRLMRLNVAGFYSDYKDIQLTLQVCPVALGFPCNLVANGADAKIKGIEVEAELHPAQGFTVDTSASYIDFSYSRKTPGLAVGDVAPLTPKWKIAVGAQYEIDAGDMGSITPRLDFLYQSSVYNDATNLPESYEKGYALLNGRITWGSADKDWEAALAVTNITDKLYYANRMANFVSSFGATLGIPGRPREWKVSITRRF